ncbi:hypothetical protein QZH41_013192 [Actinostola sp. cb2023]|nr:hypothetical protein QZH41_013192 [Actinostola sp. cb2023]
MAVNIQNSKDFSFENLHQTEREVILFCSKYNNRGSKATVHELMEDVDKFSAVSIFKSDIPLHVQCRWLTAIANQPWLIPNNSSIAEVQVNSLLQYMSSSNLWVRSLACSVVRVFSGELNPNGVHIITQVTIICKNLMTTIEGSMTSDVERFVSQVAADSLTQVLHSPILWLGILSDKERLEVIARLLSILKYFSSQKKKDNITIVKLLQATNMDSLLRTMLGQPNSIRLLLGMLLELLPPVSPSDDAPFLEVRWLSLCILWRFLHMIGITTDDNATLLSMIDQGCSSIDQVTFLHKLVSTKYKDYLSMGGFKLSEEDSALSTCTLP